MPIYEYHCRSCGEQTEVMHKIADPPATDCPACGRPELTKLVSAAGFRLSGGGWYETDFKAGAKKNLASDKAEPAKPAEAACAPSGCSKPDCGAKAGAA